MKRGERTPVTQYEKECANEIKFIRSRKGITQETMAEELGVSIFQYQSYESCKSKITIGIENKIAKIFDMTRAELVQKIEEQIAINQK